MGCFDPYSDDPRLGIQKITLCKYSNKLVVAGTAGQVHTHARTHARTCVYGANIEFDGWSVCGHSDMFEGRKKILHTSYDNIKKFSLKVKKKMLCLF